MYLFFSKFFFFFFCFLLDTSLILLFFFKRLSKALLDWRRCTALSLNNWTMRKKRRVTAVQTLTIAENSNADLKKKLTVEEQATKSADAALKGAEK